MSVVRASIGAIEAQLSNGIVTTPLEFRPGKEGGTLDFELPSRRISFQFVLTGHTLRVVVRDMRNEGVGLSNIVLHDFQQDEQRVLSLESK